MGQVAVVEGTRVETRMSRESDDAKAFSDAVAAELSEQRKRLGMTYDEVEEETGISKRHLIRILKGETSATMEQFFLVTQALATRPDVVWRAARARLRQPE